VKEKKTNIRKEREKLQFFLRIALKRKAWNGQNEQKGSNLKRIDKKKIVNKKKKRKLKRTYHYFFTHSRMLVDVLALKPHA
jgi:hypothetical protein